VDKRRRELLETLRAYMEERERQKAELRKMSESEWDQIMQKARKDQKIRYASNHDWPEKPRRGRRLYKKTLNRSLKWILRDSENSVATS